MKKLLVVGVIVLFLGLAIAPSTGTTDVKQITVPTAKGDTLYVGGSGPNNYTKIQDAIDDASDGDTVFVYSGWYNLTGGICINKAIRLIGEDKYTTVINKKRIEIVVPKVCISNFTIQNTHGISIAPGPPPFKVSNNNTISDNIFKSDTQYLDCFGGVTIYNASHNTVFNNSFFNCGLCLFLYCSYPEKMVTYPNIVYNNTVNDKPLVYLEDESDIIIDDAGQVILIGCNNITVENLEIFNMIFGINLIDSINCFISGNEFTNNLNGGISLANSNNNIISGNNILKGEIGLGLINSRYNTISDNSFENNQCNIVFTNSSYNHILYNNFKYSYPAYKAKNTFSFNSDNRWIGNFWNRARVFPVLIWGVKTTIIPWRTRLCLDIDWRPAQEPYDIEV